MLKYSGLGLAANQIGLIQAFFIMQDKKKEIYEFINPIILSSNGTSYEKEGCLSFPTIFLPIQRAESIHVKYQDRNGEFHELVAEGIDARCIAHEMEHLEGKTFLEKVNGDMRRTAKAQLKKLLKRSY